MLLLAGLLGATLVRFAPGFAVDERELDTRLSEETLNAVRAERAADAGLLAFYGNYLGGLASGDLGFSRSLNRPVRELLGERLPATLRLVAVGLLLGWMAGLGFALSGAAFPGSGVSAGGAAVAGLILSVPAALVGLAFLHGGWPREAAVGVVVFPRIYSYASRLLQETATRPHVLLARAKGVSGAALLGRHLLRPPLGELAALGGVTVSIAWGACIPLEVLCDVPGIGQLAWNAALGRDLPVLVSLTLLTALITMSANALADIAAASLRRPG